MRLVAEPGLLMQAAMGQEVVVKWGHDVEGHARLVAVEATTGHASEDVESHTALATI